FKILCLLKYALMRRHNYDITVFFTKRVVTACPSRTAATPSVISCQIAASVIAGVADVQQKEFKTSRDRHRNNGMSDVIGGLDTKVILLACSIPIGWAYAFHQDKTSSVRVPVANVTLFSSTQLLRENTEFRVSLGPWFLLGLSAFAMAAACASRTAATPSVQRKEFKTSRDRHRNNGMSDLIGGLDTKFPLFAIEVSLGPGFLLGLSAFPMAAACAFRTAATPSVISCQIAASVIAGVADVDVLLGGIYQHIHANIE
nr:hypothetical protein [Tanacetum cinerariifolium]